MLVVEYTVDSPILRRALADSRGTTVTHEQMYQREDGIKYLFWAAGGDLDAFEDGLTADPTVTDEVLIADTEGRRLYRVRFTEAGEEAATFPKWSEFDISPMHSEATADGWRVRMRMPDRDALTSYQRVCDEIGLDFELQKMYERWEPESESSVRLSPAQREALLAARELGYFEIPRDASLADVSDELGITPQSLSERLRRGVPTLIDRTIGRESN